MCQWFIKGITKTILFAFVLIYSIGFSSVFGQEVIKRKPFLSLNTKYHFLTGTYYLDHLSNNLTISALRFGVPITDHNIYLCGKINFNSNENYYIQKKAIFSNTLINLGIQYNFRFSSNIEFLSTAGITFSRKSTILYNTTNLNGIRSVSDKIIGYFLGFGLEKRFLYNPVAVFMECQYNLNFDTPTTNINLGIRYYII